MSKLLVLQRGAGLLIGVLFLMLCRAYPVQAQEVEWKKLYQEAKQLFSQSNYDEAEPVALRTFKIAEATFAPNDPEVAQSMTLLGSIYKAQGRYAQAEPLFMRTLAIWEKGLGPEHSAVVAHLNNLGMLFVAEGKYPQAEPLYKRSLAIREKTLGADHPDVAQSLNNLAELYRTQGRYAQAEPLYKRAVAIMEKAGGPDNPVVALLLNNQAELYRIQGRYVQAEPLYLRSLAIREAVRGPDHPDVALSLNNLALLNVSRGRFAQAEPLYQRSLSIMEKVRGPNHPLLAAILNNQAELYKVQAKYSQAEQLYRRSLAISEQAFGADHPDVANSLNNLAALHKVQGQYEAAEPLYKRSLDILEKTVGSEHHDVAASTNNLAELYRDQGQYAQAEQYYKRSLAINEKALGLDHPDVAGNLNNLAELYMAQGRNDLAEPLYKRSLAIHEKTLGPDHPDVALSLNNLAELYARQGQYAKAGPNYKRALTINTKAFGANHPAVAVSLNNLAGWEKKQGQLAQAEPLYKRALAIREKVYGPDHHDVAESLNNLALLYMDMHQYALAEPVYRRSLAILEKALGPVHPDVAISLNNLAGLYRARKQNAQALAFARKASAIYRKRIVSGSTSDTAIREAVRNSPGFMNHLWLLAQNPDKESEKGITEEAFQLVQLEQASGTASAIAKMASRFSSGNDALANLVKRKQDAIDARNRDEAKLVSAASKSPQDRNAADEQSLRDKLAHVNDELEAMDAVLNHRFPEYQELTRPEPLTVERVQVLMKPGEAMLVYALDEKQGGFLWVVRKDGVKFLHGLIDLKAVSAKVASVRSEMEFDNAGQLPRVSVVLLHELYEALFAPAVPHLGGAKHIMIVPARALQSLPFSALIASPPPEIKSNTDYRQVDWLVRNYAVSVLPSVSSIQALRQFAKPGSAPEPFAGFGDPLIGGSNSTMRGKRSVIDIARVFRNLNVSSNSRASAEAAEVADVEAIRGAPRLAETADELRAMAKALKSDQKSLWLQGRATEAVVKQLDLSRYRTIAFATHGVMAGEVRGIGEPGLILTPPGKGTVGDDGYLSASEIAKLKLNADWVILSACNTAAADGTPGAEGFSGLAKAFFYSGARSLLVSHWPVASEATVPLTTGMLKEYETHPELGKAEAQRKAMTALINTPNHPEYAHPLFWAPFVVVGEGGR